jgi:hypothetical protein
MVPETSPMEALTKLRRLFRQQGISGALAEAL